MGQATSYAASGETFVDASHNLELLLRCYVHDAYRVLWVYYRDDSGQKRRRMVAISGEDRITDVVSEINPSNGLHGASVTIST